MQKLGWSLILGATALLTGCSSGSQPPTNTTAQNSLTITTTSLAAGTVGAAYSSPVAASGGATPYSYSATSLPGGLSINSATGSNYRYAGPELCWDCLRNHQGDGFDDPFAAIGGFQSKHQNQPAKLAVTTASLPGGAAGSSYPSTNLQASGGVTPYTWALASGSSLPAGLNLSTGGVLSGTPAAGSGGPYSLTFVVTDSSTPPQTAQATFSLSISGTSTGPALTLTTTTLPKPR